MLCDELKEYTNPTYGSSYYDIDEVDAAIAELKDKCQMHDFFWEGCGFAKRGFKNSIAVSEAFDKLEAENAELKAENAELKKKLMPCLNGDCILTCEVVEKYGKENAELKARIQLDDDEMAGFLQLEEECGGGDLRNYIAELKAKLENVQASAYAESVDAGMRERKLKRALWLARALRARDIQRWWIAVTCAPITERACSVWNNVELKCRAKAEENK